MDRRAFIAATLNLLAAPRAVRAQPQTGRVYRLGLLVPSAPPPPSTPPGLFSYMRAGLRELGYREGQNLVVEQRYAEDRSERLPALAQELVRLNLDVIVAVAGAVQAAKAATT